MTRPSNACLLVAAAVAGVSGCGTSMEVRKLSMETAAAVQALDVAISANAAAAKKAAASADARIGNLILRTAETRSDMDARMAADNRGRREFEELRDFAETQEARRQKAMADAAKAAQALTEAREKAMSPSPALKEVSDKLTALGKEESAWERLKAGAGFVRDVARRVKENGEAAKDAGDKAEKDAQAATDKLSGKAGTDERAAAESGK